MAPAPAPTPARRALLWSTLPALAALFGLLWFRRRRQLRQQQPPPKTVPSPSSASVCASAPPAPEPTAPASDGPPSEESRRKQAEEAPVAPERQRSVSACPARGPAPAPEDAPARPAAPAALAPSRDPREGSPCPEVAPARGGGREEVPLQRNAPSPQERAPLEPVAPEAAGAAEQGDRNSEGGEDFSQTSVGGGRTSLPTREDSSHKEETAEAREAAVAERVPSEVCGVKIQSEEACTVTKTKKASLIRESEEVLNNKEVQKEESAKRVVIDVTCDQERKEVSNIINFQVEVPVTKQETTVVSNSPRTEICSSRDSGISRSVKQSPVKIPASDECSSLIQIEVLCSSGEACPVEKESGSRQVCNGFGVEDVVKPLIDTFSLQQTVCSSEVKVNILATEHSSPSIVGNSSDICLKNTAEDSSQVVQEVKASIETSGTTTVRPKVANSKVELYSTYLKSETSPIESLEVNTSIEDSKVVNDSRKVSEVAGTSEDCEELNHSSSVSPTELTSFVKPVDSPVTVTSNNSKGVIESTEIHKEVTNSTEPSKEKVSTVGYTIEENLVKSPTNVSSPIKDSKKVVNSTETSETISSSISSSSVAVATVATEEVEHSDCLVQHVQDVATKSVTTKEVSVNAQEEEESANSRKKSSEEVSVSNKSKKQSLSAKDSAKTQNSPKTKKTTNNTHHKEKELSSPTQHHNSEDVAKADDREEAVPTVDGDEKLKEEVAEDNPDSFTSTKAQNLARLIEQLAQVVTEEVSKSESDNSAPPSTMEQLHVDAGGATVAAPAPSPSASCSSAKGTSGSSGGDACRDSANHSPAEGMLASPRACFSDAASEEDSSDSGKGCSDAPTPPSRTPASGSSVSGDGAGTTAGDGDGGCDASGGAADAEAAADATAAAAAAAGARVYEFVLPQHLVGRLIGRHGCFVHQIKARTNASILIKRHPDTARLKICAVEGSTADVEGALEMIRQKFPEKRYPNVSLEQVCFVTPPLSVVPVLPDCLRLQLVEGITNDVIVSSLVTPAHFFLQQPTHPTFPALVRLGACMDATYGGDVDTPAVPTVQAGIVVAAPVMGSWYRAEVVASEPDEETCQVRYVDYGGYEVQMKSTLRQIRSDFMTLPFQAAECYLANVICKNEEEGWSTEALATVEQMTAGQVIQAQVCGYCEDGVPAVCLYSVFGTQVVSVGQELVARGLAQWWEPADG